MKKYFTKYLPVEGKILGCKRSECASMCSAKEPLKSNCDNSGPHKLFLCSLEIQVGDLIGSSRNGLFTATEHHVEKHKGAYFKIIGEVSPAAVWVTEGMEFGELEEGFYQGNFQKLPVYKGDTQVTLLGSNAQKQKLIDSVEFGNLVEKYVILFKCPTCKTFH